MAFVVEEFRATEAIGPLRVFVHQTIASQDWAEDEFIRIVGSTESGLAQSMDMMW